MSGKGIAVGIFFFACSLPVVLGQEQQSRSNILFVILDDVGIDQLHSFGYGGTQPPPTPVIDAVAQAGLRFRNVWAMPECSPSRAMFFEGRYPFRTNVLNAIVPGDLANSQVSPFETTTPKVLKRAQYRNALIGKFHLTGENNPFGDSAPLALGWDYYFGYNDPDPPSIDTTAGGVAAQGTYSCGFIPGTDAGACYMADQTCQAIAPDANAPVPGRSCLEKGGIFVPGASCQATPPANLNFTSLNAYYVWPITIGSDGHAERVASTDPRARKYSPSSITDEAIRWINSLPSHQPWMATIAYPSIHTPYQQAPTGLLPAGSTDLTSVACNNLANAGPIGDQMLSAVDTELGRLLVGVGLASYDSQGHVMYDPSAANTMVVVIGDNGTYAPSVKQPFDPSRSKGSTFQTGVWVPLIVAGSLVQAPNRDVTNMVNIADLYQFFGELAGLDVHRIAPRSRIIDSASMMPYLTNPAQPSIRTYNFTQTGNNIRAATPAGMCILGSQCTNLVTTASLCSDNGGTWIPGVTSCCAAMQATGKPLQVAVDLQNAIRNDTYKLVETHQPNCTTGQEDVLYSFYEIDEAAPSPKLDRANLNLLTSPSLPAQGLTDDQLSNFNALLSTMQDLLQSEVACPGDGNGDHVVDFLDLANWVRFHNRGSSWYDFNFDGSTDQSDLQVILDNLGKRCR
ncbi:MAG TPA: sulfatase-like hydrolase/transferase [Bryobacteraceae bacterium]|nr:sulfatase-like hydrolase/transferase [Bryobacteraceae bacterium]